MTGCLAPLRRLAASSTNCGAGARTVAGLNRLTSIGASGYITGGVAVFAHIGGFIAGVILVVLMGGTRRPRPVAQEYWS